MRDLLGDSSNLAEDLPPDPSFDGFDINAEMLETGVLALEISSGNQFFQSLGSEQEKLI